MGKYVIKDTSPLTKFCESIGKYNIGIYDNKYSDIVSKESLTSYMVNIAVILGIHPVFNYFKEDYSLCVAGGAFRSICEKEVPTDMDVFLLGKFEDNVRKLELLHNDLTLSKIACSRVKHYEVQLESDPSGWNKQIAILDIHQGEDIPIPLQYIAHRYTHGASITEHLLESASDVISTFDFTAVAFGAHVNVLKFPVHAGNIKFVSNAMHPDFYSDVATKTLAFNLLGRLGTKRISVNRFYKYITEYGFRIKDNTSLRLFDRYVGNPHGIRVTNEEDGDDY